MVTVPLLLCAATALMVNGGVPPVSLANTGIETSVPCDVAALSSTAISAGGGTGGGAVTVTVTVAESVWPALSRTV